MLHIIGYKILKEGNIILPGKLIYIGDCQNDNGWVRYVMQAENCDNMHLSDG